MKFISPSALGLLLCSALTGGAQEQADSVAYAAPTDSLPGYEQLDGVTVTAKKPVIQTRADRVIYNTDEDPQAGTSTVIDMMRKVPMLSVDGEDNIKYKGNSSFKVYLNGKPDPALSSNYKDVLRSMPASSIRRIEVITEPGAKYDAEGTDAIINIVTVNATKLEGYSLSIGANGGNNGAGEFLFGTVKIDKVTINANYSHYNSFDPASPSSAITDYESGSIARQVSWLSNHSRGYNNFGNLNLSWEPDTLNLFTLSGQIWAFHSSSDGAGRTYSLDRQGREISGYARANSGIGDYLGSGAQANWQHNFTSPEHNLVLSYQYSYGHQKSTQENSFTDFFGLDPATLPDRLFSSRYPTHEHTFQADYTNPFGKMHVLETGAKYVLRNNYGYTDYYQGRAPMDWTLDEANSIDMKQFQDIASAYLSYTFKYRAIMLKAGLRYEYTHMGSRFKTPGHSDFTTDLNDWIPSAIFSVNLSEGSLIKLSYNTKVQRPSVSQLDPTVNSSNPIAISYGNPDLSSARSHYVGLTYSNYAHAFGGEFAAGYNRFNNLIRDYTVSGSDGVLVTTYGNLGHADGVGLSAYLTYRAPFGLSVGANCDATYTHYKYSLIEFDRDNWNWSVNVNGDYDLPRGWSVGAYYGYWSGGLFGQYKSDDSSWYGFYASKSLINDRLTLSASVNNILIYIETTKIP